MTETYADLGGQPSNQLSVKGEAFLAALSREARVAFHRTDAARAAFIRCIERGWTPEALARECSRDLGSAANVGGIVQHRLEQCARTDPPKAGGLPRFVQPKPWCGHCSDEYTRFRLDTDTAERCDCWTDPRGVAA